MNEGAISLPRYRLEQMSDGDLEMMSLRVANKGLVQVSERWCALGRVWNVLPWAMAAAGWCGHLTFAKWIPDPAALVFGAGIGVPAIALTGIRLRHAKRMRAQKASMEILEAIERERLRRCAPGHPLDVPGSPSPLAH